MWKNSRRFDALFIIPDIAAFNEFKGGSPDILTALLRLKSSATDVLFLSG